MFSCPLDYLSNFCQENIHFDSFWEVSRWHISPYDGFQKLLTIVINTNFYNTRKPTFQIVRPDVIHLNTLRWTISSQFEAKLLTQWILIYPPKFSYVTPKIHQALTSPK